MSGLAALVPSVSRPANRICKLPYSNCTSSHKKNRSSELGGFFCSNLSFYRFYLIVEMEGLEPSSKQATWIFSTCLVFI